MTPHAIAQQFADDYQIHKRNTEGRRGPSRHVIYYWPDPHEPRERWARLPILSALRRWLGDRHATQTGSPAGLDLTAATLGPILAHLPAVCPRLHSKAITGPPADLSTPPASPEPPPVPRLDPLWLRFKLPNARQPRDLELLQWLTPLLDTPGGTPELELRAQAQDPARAFPWADVERLARVMSIWLIEPEPPTPPSWATSPAPSTDPTLLSTPWLRTRWPRHAALRWLRHNMPPGTTANARDLLHHGGCAGHPEKAILAALPRLRIVRHGPRRDRLWSRPALPTSPHTSKF